MFNKIFIFVALLLANFSIFVNSQTAGLKVSNFRAYRNFKFIGGLQNYVPADNKFKCIMECTSKASCQGFSYEGDICHQVNRSSVTGLDFSADPINNRIRRNVLLNNMPFDTETLFTLHTVTLVNKLSIGDMVYLRARLLQHSNVQLDIYDTPSMENITYHMRARCGDGTCYNRFVDINFRFNSDWNATFYHGFTYTLVLNVIFEFHLLITANGIVTYLNRVYLHTLSTALSAVTANYISISGNMEVIEFSV